MQLSNLFESHWAESPVVLTAYEDCNKYDPAKLTTVEKVGGSADLQGLENGWKKLTAYLNKPGAAIQLVTKRHGKHEIMIAAHKPNGEFVVGTIPLQDQPELTFHADDEFETPTDSTYFMKHQNAWNAIVDASNHSYGAWG